MAGELVCKAFLQLKNRTIGNTSTINGKLYFFKNLIAEWHNNEIYIQDSGRCTSTTRDRLNKIGARLSIKKGSWYLNGFLWDGKLVNMRTYSGVIKEKERTSLFEL